MTYREFAKKSGAVIRENFALGMKKEWKGNNTPITVTDTQINHTVIEAVKAELSRP